MIRLLLFCFVALPLLTCLSGCGDNKKAQTPAAVVPLESQDKKPPKPGRAQ